MSDFRFNRLQAFLVIPVLVFVACESSSSSADAEIGSPDAPWTDSLSTRDSLNPDPDSTLVPDDASNPDSRDIDPADATEPTDTADDGGPDPDVPIFVVPEFLGGDRPAAVHVPSYFDQSRSWPAIVVLHGYGASGLLQSAYLGLYDSLETHGYVLIAPDGTVNPEGYQFWNAGAACCDYFQSNVDDVAYIGGLIREAVEKLPIDPDRVSLIGHSNGGFMALRMACDEAGLLSGIASIAGSMPETLPCSPSRPVSILLIHGTNDTTIKYGGGSIYGVKYQGAEDLAEAWADRNSCGSGPTEEPSPVDYDSNIDGSETTVTGWADCSRDSRVDIWRMDDSTHAPAFNDTFKKAVIDLMLGW